MEDESPATLSSLVILSRSKYALIQKQKTLPSNVLLTASSSSDCAIWRVSTMPQCQWSDGKLDFLFFSPFLVKRHFYLVQWP